MVYTDKTHPGKLEFLVLGLTLLADVIVFIYIYRKTGFELVNIPSVKLYVYVIAVICTIFFVTFGISVFSTEYIITDNSIGIKCCSMYKEIPLSDVKEVRRFDWRKDLHNVRTCAKITGLVTIILRNGFIDKVVITPEHPEQFIREVQERTAREKS